jgi:hypothetical protein
MIPEADPARTAPEATGPEVFVDPDGRSAAQRALDHGGPRSAVWVGEPTDAALAEFRAEIGRRR